MSNFVRFGCTALAGSSKVGNLKKDANGYYEVVVGALNVYNSAGELYVYEQAKELFESSSQLMRRIKRGTLRGEYGHPKKQVGMSDRAFMSRIMTIDEGSICCHHKEITLDFDRVKDANGKPVISIISKVLPSGPMGPALEKSLNNKDENVCFSIRAFTDDEMKGGVNHRVLKSIITWDFVNEPGIAVAEKFKSPALEMFSEITSKNVIADVLNTQKAGIATESVILTGDELFKSMGWDVSSVPKAARPKFLGW